MNEENNQNTTKNVTGLINIETDKLGETVLEMYRDSLQPTVRETGNLLTFVPRGIRAVLKPFEKWIIQNEFECKEFASTLEKKLEGKDVVTPERYVAIPLLEALSYSYDSSELRDLYAVLLANAMDPETKSSAHPAFVDIIRQLSPLEAKLLKETTLLRKGTPICSICIAESNELLDKNSVFQLVMPTGTLLYRHFAIFEQTSTLENPIETTSALLDNLIRLGLIEKLEITAINDDSVYEVFASSKLFKKLQQDFEVQNTDPNKNIYLIKMALIPTEFGRLFYDICVK